MTKSAADVSVRPPRKRRSTYTLAPLVLIAANVVLFALFFVWPAVIGLVYSFTNYTGVGAFQFIGLDNYQNLFGDSTFYDALFRTLLYAVLVVPLNFVLSLFIANLVVSKQAKGASVARVVFFIPWLISPIVVGVLWRWLFGENFGLINYVIEKLGGHAIAWQSNADLSLGVVVMAGAWWGTAFSMLLFIAAIKNVPVSYYEAASLDGAGPWRQFRSITLPSIAPTSFIVILLNTINAMKEYPLFVSLNNGGPGTSNNLLVQYIYQTGFNRGQIGYASAASFVLMLILMAVAIIQLIVNRRVENR
ncbi:MULTISPECIES: carbohydrate ABC transporter permease [Streptomyces]|jgi:alpha-1,4-digalacturonate transport system permease protein|uniref:Sugar ABC transporter permease n=1 Tax=Streptomyces prunicolor TaxID=67348 RepID=A0ABU4F1X0_9ACTN|nr:sugar ABC transporter permease [Streptomyces prunicolor]MDV7214579.1 sugar ABC transporter permease [Streptomyces prunicolor]WSV17693.1 sugar ABC transporter permease [Streptomyces prunicolor]